jgi:DNA polymerase III delta subunit
MVEPGAFIFLGSDELKKQERLDAFLKKLFPPELREFNYTLFYGDDKQFRPQELKEVLISFPTEGAKKRLIVIKAAHKMSAGHQACLTKELKETMPKAVVVLDVPEVKGTEDFVEKFVQLGAEVVRFKSDVPMNVFDLGRAIIGRKPDSALKILSRLLRYREKTEKILGALFWQWERFYTDKRLSETVYRGGLKLMLDADRRLKSSASAYGRERLILEALVVKLSYLA